MELLFTGQSEAVVKKNVDVAIIGAGPAGLTAGIYAARSGLSSVIIDKNIAGGLAAEAPFVENYPPFKGIKGEELLKKMKEHAQEYTDILEMNPVKSIEMSNGAFHIDAEHAEIESRTVIFATGTTHKFLQVKGEKELYGRGISYCVTCDGYFYKGKKVVVIGGGNSGAVAALSLFDIDADVTVLEYMDRWMCEEAYKNKIMDKGIPYITGAQVVEIAGDKNVNAVKYIDRKSGEAKSLETDGVFIYVGLIPLSELAKNIGIALDKRGYIATDGDQRTNVRYVYAAGDITGGVAQIIVAASEGATAALSAYEDLKIKG